MDLAAFLITFLFYQNYGLLFGAKTQYSLGSKAILAFINLNVTQWWQWNHLCMHFGGMSMNSLRFSSIRNNSDAKNMMTYSDQ